MLIIRWLVVLLVIFMAAYSPKGLDFSSPNYLLSIIYLVLNLAVSFIPQRYFNKGWFVYLLFVLDIIFVSAVVYFAEGIDTDFYLIYFLSIFMSSVGQNVKGTIPVALVASIMVQDNGCGIPPENLDAIFKPFFTTKQAGTGLGMAIIQKIIEEHQGQINVESEIGKGTTFSLVLPAAAETEAQGN